MQRLRALWLDVFLVVFGVADGLSVLLSDQRHPVLGACLSAASVLVLTARRYSPLAAGVAAFGLTAIGAGLSSTSTTLQFFGILLIFAVVGAVNGNRDALLSWLVGLAALGYTELVLVSGLGWNDFLLTAAFCTTMTAAGWLVGHRSRQVHAVRTEAARDVETERKRAARALAEQRAELARELHDVVSHGLSVVVLQAQAARLAAADLSAPGTAELDRHLDAVESTAREALAEMRRLLGLLQLDERDGAGPPAPRPGAADLPALVERCRGAGLDVRLSEPTGLPALSAGLGLTVYRTVQEALTNAAKHAPGAVVVVTVGTVGSTLEVLVTSTEGTRGAGTSEGTFEGAGRGLVGMRERVEMYGGRLEVAPTDEGGFRLAAVLPLDDAAVPVGGEADRSA